MPALLITKFESEMLRIRAIEMLDQITVISVAQPHTEEALQEAHAVLDLLHDTAEGRTHLRKRITREQLSEVGISFEVQQP